MGWNYRKSVNLGGGIRLNFSKKGVGVSGGIKGFRVSTGPTGTRVHSSIPGTGIYYTKKIDNTPHGIVYGNGKNNASIRASDQYYEQTVSNSYTGESRTLRASTQWELRSLVENEVERQTRNELTQKNLELAEKTGKQADEMTKQQQSAREALGHLIQDTLSVDDKLDWEAQIQTDNTPPFEFKETPPIKDKTVKGIDFKYEVDLDEFEIRRQKALHAYRLEKEKREKAIRQHNAEILFLREKFEEYEETAIVKYSYIILSNSKYPPEIDLDFDLTYTRRDRTLIVNCLLPSVEEMPVVERYTSSRGSISEHDLPAKEIKALYDNVIYSVVLRTIHELFESLYTNCADRIIFNGFLSDDENNTRCVITCTVQRSIFESVDLLSNTPQCILSSFVLNDVNDFRNPEKAVEPVEG